MPSLLRMPEIAANTPEATLVSWAVAENVPYSASDAIATVETAKAVVDVEADSDGVIFKTLIADGTDVQVGAAIAVIGTPGETVDDLDSVLVALGVGPSGAEDGLDEPGVDDGGALGDPVPPGPVVEAHLRPGAGDASSPPATSTANGTGGRIFISPLARRLARDAGLDIADLAGTGPNDRIIRRDVEAAIANQAETRRTPAPAPDTEVRPARSTAAPAPSAAFEDVPHTRLRRAIAARLTESVQSAPHFYLFGAPRVDRLLKLRREVNAHADVRVSVNDLIVKAVAGAHQLVPAMNVIWTPDAVRRFSTVDVAVAVATPSGLVTPVVRDLQSMSLTAVAAATKDYAERARTGRLHQHELEGGSITVTNLGMFGTREFAAVINPPHAAILAVGAAVQEPVVKNDKVKLGTVMRVTLSVDHRPVDGSVAAEWMQAFVSLVEHPLQILA
jgi:pyruvate dehydrogenase E2 component (dihydrolipoamide acetyltransferase)